MRKLFFVIMMQVLSFSLMAQTIEQVYHFDKPTFEFYQNYEQINFENCVQSAEVGSPVMPWHSVSILLPQNTESENIEVIFSDFVDVDGSHLIYPYQKPRPISSTEFVPFEKNQDLYKSNDVYPAETYSEVKTQFLNGYSFAFSGFTPVRYIPSEGKLSYAQTVTVRVSYKSTRADKSKMLNTNPDVMSRVERLAHNAEVLSLYSDTQKTRSLSGYELLVITPQEWVSHFDEYKEFYEARALRTKVVALEDIYASNEGCDEQEKIRSFIADEYQNEGVMMVLLGGDSNLVPYRCLYCYVSDENQDDCLPSDMYYVCLDGTWNDDNDELWGEVGEDDLLPELAIARMPFNNEQQFNNMMHKTLEYQSNPVLGEFNDVILGAEHLGDGYYGSHDMDRLIGENSDFEYTTIGVPEYYNVHRVYADGPTGWSGAIFKDKINEVGGSYVHHLGHANTDYVAGWYVNSTNDASFSKLDGVNHNYNFFHSHGCICGDFTKTCMLERLVNISTGFVAATGNSRYGWYMPWGDGPAAHLNREFVDSYYNDRLPYIGTAFVEMKIQTAPYVTNWYENGALRWNIYCLNILGDVAVCPWLDEPFVPEVSYEMALRSGTASTEVKVNKDGAPQSNFRCSLFHNDQLIAYGLTDENGEATLQFDQPLNIVDTMQLILTGPNAWYQTFDVIGLSDAMPYVYAKSINIDDSQGNNNYTADYDEDMNLDIEFYNPSAVNVDNITATISTTTPDYVEITNATINVGLMEANTVKSSNDAFTMTVKEGVPNQEYARFDIVCSDGNNTWNQEFLLKIDAPVIQITEISYDDSMGDNNGFVDAGERVQIHVKGKNIGNSKTKELQLEVSSLSDYAVFEETHFTHNAIGANEEFHATFILDIVDNIDGEQIDVVLNVNSGSYSDEGNLRFTVGTVRDDFETADFYQLDWGFDNDLPWVITDTQSHSGTYSAESGRIADDEISSLIIDIENTTDGEISFYYKLSTEKNCDYFVFYIDGKMQDRWSGESDWKQIAYDVPAGRHTFEWRYDKNQRDTEGADRCWIDDVVFPHNTMVVGVETVTESKEFNIYPNPADNYIIIKGDDIKQIEIYDMVGRNLITKTVENSNSVIDISDLNKGIYLIRSIDAGNNVLIEKVIKQ